MYICLPFPFSRRDKEEESDSESESNRALVPPNSLTFEAGAAWWLLGDDAVTMLWRCHHRGSSTSSGSSSSTDGGEIGSFKRQRQQVELSRFSNSLVDFASAPFCFGKVQQQWKIIKGSKSNFSPESQILKWARGRPVPYTSSKSHIWVLQNPLAHTYVHSYHLTTETLKGCAFLM